MRERMYPTPVQETGMLGHCAHSRYVWNLALEQAKMWRAWQGPTPNAAQRMRQLAAARGEHPWLAEGSSVVQQGALRDFDRAMSGFFAGRAGYPRWRKTGIGDGFVIRDLRLQRLNRRWAAVLVPKIGWVKLRTHRGWSALVDATSARVTYRHRQWHVSFTTPPPAQVISTTGAVVGIDRGVANTLATSDGDLQHAPGFSAAEQARFVALQQRLSRQVKGSNRRARTIASLGRLHLRLGNRRTDWIEQITTHLARTYQVIALEDLNITGMTRKPAPRPDPSTPGIFLPNQARAKAALNRTILASCWGRFQTRLTTKTGPDRVALVNPRNTSRTCHECGHTDAGNRESQAVFQCRECGHTAHADINAAKNILLLAISHPTGGQPGIGRNRGRRKPVTTTASSSLTRGRATA